MRHERMRLWTETTKSKEVPLHAMEALGGEEV
jgi:hypothetical protein